MKKSYGNNKRGNQQKKSSYQNKKSKTTYKSPFKNLPATINHKPNAPEKKTLDSFKEITPGLPSAGDDGFCVNLTIEGSGPSQRIGRKINMKSLRIRGWLDWVNSYDSKNIYRLVVVYDRQTNGVQPAFNTVFQNIDTSGTFTTNILSPLSVNKTDRFIVLADEILYMASENASSTGGLATDQVVGLYDPMSTLRNFDRYIKLNQEVQYQASTGVVGDISAGGIYIYFKCHEDPPALHFYCNTRLRYIDI